MTTFDLEVYRERRRMHMARYRKKQDDKVATCEEDVKRLRQQVQQLEQQRDLLATGIPTKTTPWNVAAEYFRLFRNGYKAPVMVADPSTGELCQRGPNIQENFLRATMAADVMDFGVRGIDKLLENMKQSSHYFQHMDVRLVRLETDADESIVAILQAKITVSENAIRRFFSHVVSDDEYKKWRLLYSRLLRQQLLLNASLSFDWDDTNACVTRLVHQGDMMTPLMGLLGDVAHVFDSTLKLTSKCTLVSEKGEESSQ
ncbi:hypothetical protein PHYBOEH_000563 [Phytophthora boehmeriae]|uniref:Bzip transcription factor n=1 Tax=Phytophthora boehmeriae TaxID=109152 RepID=A0A8T1VA48_9STRA|nr:hypothetical protein PHYBOEH_000563 [Phytophthora boehmeriae]